MGFGFLVVGGFGLEASRFKGLRLKRLKRLKLAVNVLGFKV